MAHLWIQTERQWSILPLEAPADLSHHPPRTLNGDEAGGSPGRVLLMPSSPGSSCWVLIHRAESAVRVNGWRLPSGLAVLSDQDEIQIDQTPPLYFSTETLAELKSFTPLDRRIHCGRCKQEIVSSSPPDDTVVECPACHVLHHETAGRPCWTYTPTCSFCDQPTALDSGFRWTPERL